MVIHAEEFNEVHRALNKVYNAQQSDQDLRALAILWAYRSVCKKLMEKMPSRLTYGANAIIPMESIMPSSHIAAPTDMKDRGALEEGIVQLDEEERLGHDEEIQQVNLRL